MAASNFAADHHKVTVVSYSSDVFAQTVDSICLRDYGRVTFLLNVGSTGGDSSTVTVCAFTSATASGGTAMAFRYRSCTGTTSGDTWSAWTAATSAGFALSATAYKCYEIEVTAAEVAAALAGAYFVYLAFADAGSASYGNIDAILTEARYTGGVPATAIA